MSDRDADKKEWRYITREFLNDPLMDFHSQAFAIMRVEDTSYSKRKTKHLVVPTLGFTLSDCSESIDLFFDMYTEAGIRNSRYKIRHLRDAINKFADALEAEMDLVEQRIKDRKEAKKNKKAEEPGDESDS